MTTSPASRRSYSDDEKAVALVVAEAFGNVSLAAISLGIPERTLNHWTNGERVSSHVTKVLVQERRAEVDSLLEALCRKALGVSSAAIEEMGERVPGASVPALARIVKTLSGATKTSVEMLLRLRRCPHCNRPLDE